VGPQLTARNGTLRWLKRGLERDTLVTWRNHKTILCSQETRHTPQWHYKTVEPDIQGTLGHWQTDSGPHLFASDNGDQNTFDRPRWRIWIRILLFYLDFTHTLNIPKIWETDVTTLSQLKTIHNSYHRHFIITFYLNYYPSTFDWNKLDVRMYKYSYCVFYTVWVKKTLRFSDNFFPNVWEFLINFYTHSIRSFLHYMTNFYSIISKFDAVMPY